MNNTNIETLINLLKKLRKECPWDKEQTNKSLRTLTIEEVYELSDAIINDDLDNIEEELGDVLIHIILHYIILSEKNNTSFEHIISKAIQKLKTRHPHIFNSNNKKKISVKEIDQEWENSKEKENRRTFEGMPQNLPSMLKAICINKRISSKGFDWEKKEDSYEKIFEEFKELEVEVKNNSQYIESEIGDIFFSLINYCNFLNVNPDSALEKTNKKVIARFKYVEDRLLRQRIAFKDASIKLLNKYWEEAKRDVS